jgi:hypothetical protein
MVGSARTQTDRINIDDICERSGLPKDVVPNFEQMEGAIHSESSGISCVDHLPSKYYGRPARPILYREISPGDGFFEGPDLDAPIRKESHLQIIPGITHQELGVLATVVPIDGTKYELCYFLKE